MKRKFITILPIFLTAAFICTACNTSVQSNHDINYIEETTIKSEIKTESVTQSETETHAENSAFYSVNYDHFFDEGPIEYQDYFHPELKFSISLSNGKVSHKMDESEDYFWQSFFLIDHYENIKRRIESEGRSKEDLYCLYIDVELTNKTSNDIIYSIENWNVFQIVKTELGDACEFLASFPCYNYHEALYDGPEYYEMEMKADETKKFRVVFVIDKEEYFDETGMYFDEEHTDNLYLSMTGDESLISTGINGEYAPNDSENLKLLKILVNK